MAEPGRCVMLYVRQPTPEEHQALKRLTRQAVGRVSQRAQMVLLSAQRRTVPEIATIFDVSRATVRFWLRRFEAQGWIERTQGKEGDGRRRPITLTEAGRQRFQASDALTRAEVEMFANGDLILRQLERIESGAWWRAELSREGAGPTSRSSQP